VKCVLEEINISGLY